MMRFKEYIIENSEEYEPKRFILITEFGTSSISKDADFTIYFLDNLGNILPGQLDANDTIDAKLFQWLDIKKIEKELKPLGHAIIVVSPKYQEWLVKNYPGTINIISNLDPDLKKKYSHLVMGDKFGVFDDD